jgi:hypothetical protein
LFDGTLTVGAVPDSSQVGLGAWSVTVLTVTAGAAAGGAAGLLAEAEADGAPPGLELKSAPAPPVLSPEPPQAMTTGASEKQRAKNLVRSMFMRSSSELRAPRLPQVHM